jgi:NAD(P)-dependent dehydrogenase (short-subunit alcohol dehydrogenase family)
MSSIQGKRAIVSGPTSGVGKEIALYLSALGAELILTSRGLQKGNQTALEIIQSAGSSKPVAMYRDTSS